VCSSDLGVYDEDKKKKKRKVKADSDLSDFLK